MGKEDKGGRGKRYMNYLLDTNIIIDANRNHPPAYKFVKSLDEIIISSLVLFELVKGARNKRELSTLKKGFKELTTIYSDEAIQKRALEIYSECRLSCDLPIIDSIIAATAIENDLVLVTRDKHFKAIKDLEVYFPY